MGALTQRTASTTPVGSGIRGMLGSLSKPAGAQNTMKKGGAVKSKAAPAKAMASGGKVSSASKRADGCAIRGKTKGRMV
jgi:hypothetical protein